MVLGYLIYRGFTINLTRFFTRTAAFLVLVAAGVLAYGVHDLQEADFLPGLNNLAFDVSETIDPNSWYGTLLKGIFNFSPASTKLFEVIVWADPTSSRRRVSVLRSLRCRAAAAPSRRRPPRAPITDLKEAPRCAHP